MLYNENFPSCQKFIGKSSLNDCLNSPPLGCHRNHSPTDLIRLSSSFHGIWNTWLPVFMPSLFLGFLKCETFVAHPQGLEPSTWPGQGPLRTIGVDAWQEVSPVETQEATGPAGRRPESGTAHRRSGLGPLGELWPLSRGWPGATRHRRPRPHQPLWLHDSLPLLPWPWHSAEKVTYFLFSKKKKKKA